MGLSGSTVASLIAVALVIYSIVLHEVAHGYAALLLGDHTALRAGRLSLNPLRHIDPLFTVAMPIFLWVASRGAFVFGSAKPVPVNLYNLRRPERDHMLVALSGPAVNILIAVAAGLVLRVPMLAPNGSFNQDIFLRLAIWNIWLALFNLIPVPPLDGSSVVVWLLPRELSIRYAALRRYGMLLLIVVLVVLSATGVFDMMQIGALRFVELVSGLVLLPRSL